MQTHLDPTLIKRRNVYNCICYTNNYIYHFRLERLQLITYNISHYRPYSYSMCSYWEWKRFKNKTNKIWLSQIGGKSIKPQNIPCSCYSVGTSKGGAVEWCMSRLLHEQWRHYGRHKCPFIRKIYTDIQTDFVLFNVKCKTCR